MGRLLAHFLLGIGIGLAIVVVLLWPWLPERDPVFGNLHPAGYWEETLPLR